MLNKIVLILIINFFSLSLYSQSSKKYQVIMLNGPYKQKCSCHDMIKSEFPLETKEEAQTRYWELKKANFAATVFTVAPNEAYVIYRRNDCSKGVDCWILNYVKGESVASIRKKHDQIMANKKSAYYDSRDIIQ